MIEVLFPDYDPSRFGNRRFNFHFQDLGSCTLTGDEILKIGKPNNIQKLLIDTLLKEETKATESEERTKEESPPKDNGFVMLKENVNCLFFGAPL